MSQQNIPLGLFCALSIVCIWSGFIVFSRVGVTTELTAYDITALRFATGALIVAPFAWTWWPRALPVKAIALLSLSGPGVIYSILVYLGLNNASAAYGGVFTNGSLPLFAMVLMFFLNGEKPLRQQLIAVVLIMIGGVGVGLPGMLQGGKDVALGIVLFLCASATIAIYMAGLRHWQVAPKQALALVNIPNALVFLPIWYFFLPTGLAQADLDMIIFQALFQGIGPSFLAVILFSLSLHHLGATVTAGFSAIVPATAALLAIPILAESPTPIEWAGIVVVTIGLAALVYRQ